MKKPFTAATLVMGIGAIVVVVFSFLNFYTSPIGGGVNAWNGDALFPATIIPVILAVGTIVFIVLELVGVSLPEKLLTFTWPQIYATWGISAAGIMLGWLFSNPLSGGIGAGLLLMLLGSMAMATGSIMGMLGVGTNDLIISSGGSSTPSAPGAPTPPPGGAYPPSAPDYSQSPPPPPPSGDPPPPPPPA